MTDVITTLVLHEDKSKHQVFFSNVASAGDR